MRTRCWQPAPQQALLWGPRCSGQKHTSHPACLRGPGVHPSPTPRWGESTCPVPGTLVGSRDEADTGEKEVINQKPNEQNNRQ